MVVQIVLRRLTLLWNVERAIQGWNQPLDYPFLSLPPKEQIGKGKGWWVVVDVGKSANCQPSHSIGCTTNQFLVKQKACKGKTFDQGYNWQWEFPPPCHVSRLMEEDICVTNIDRDLPGESYSAELITIIWETRACNQPTLAWRKNFSKLLTKSKLSASNKKVDRILCFLVETDQAMWSLEKEIIDSYISILW